MMEIFKKLADVLNALLLQIMRSEQLLKNRKIFSEFFSAFLKSTQKLEYFEKEDDPPRFFVSEIIDCKKRSFLNAQKALCQKTYGQSTC